jgi:hypothetical protein
MQLGSMFINNCNNALRSTSKVDGFCTSAEAIDLGRSYWILHPISCLTPEAVTTVFKCS